MLKSLKKHLLRYKLPLGLGFLFIFFNEGAGLMRPWILRYVVDGLTVGVPARRLLFYAGFIIALSVVQGFFRFWMRKLMIGVSRKIEYDLRNEYFAHIQTQPFGHPSAVVRISLPEEGGLSDLYSLLGPAQVAHDVPDQVVSVFVGHDLSVQVASLNEVVVGQLVRVTGGGA